MRGAISNDRPYRDLIDHSMPIRLRAITMVPLSENMPSNGLEERSVSDSQINRGSTVTRPLVSHDEE